MLQDNLISLRKIKHIFRMVKVGDKGQIVIPSKARKIFNIHFVLKV